jgi:hypothetical protein
MGTSKFVGDGLRGADALGVMDENPV